MKPQLVFKNDKAAVITVTKETFNKLFYELHGHNFLKNIFNIKKEKDYNYYMILNLKLFDKYKENSTKFNNRDLNYKLLIYIPKNKDTSKVGGYNLESSGEQPIDVFSFLAQYRIPKRELNI